MKTEQSGPGRQARWTGLGRSAARRGHRRWTPMCGRPSAPCGGRGAASRRTTRGTGPRGASTSSSRWRRSARPWRRRRSGCRRGPRRTSAAAATAWGAWTHRGRRRRRGRGPGASSGRPGPGGAGRPGGCACASPSTLVGRRRRRRRCPRGAVGCRDFGGVLAAFSRGSGARLRCGRLRHRRKRNESTSWAAHSFGGVGDAITRTPARWDCSGLRPGSWRTIRIDPWAAGAPIVCFERIYYGAKKKKKILLLRHSRNRNFLLASNWIFLPKWHYRLFPSLTINFLCRGCCGHQNNSYVAFYIRTVWCQIKKSINVLDVNKEEISDNIINIIEVKHGFLANEGCK